MKDSKILHFLKNFPAWIVLMFLTLIFAALYYFTGDASYKEWTSLVLASLFTALGIQRQPSQSANTNSGDVVIQPEPLTNLTAAEIDGEIKEEKEN